MHSRGRFSKRDLRFIEVFTGDLRVLCRGGGCGVDFCQFDFDFGHAHLRCFFGCLRGRDFFLGGNSLRHVGQDQQGAGGKDRQGHANGSASSHHRLISSACAGASGGVLNKRLSTFATLGNKHTTSLIFHTCINRNICIIGNIKIS